MIAFLVMSLKLQSTHYFAQNHRFEQTTKNDTELVSSHKQTARSPSKRQKQNTQKEKDKESQSQVKETTSQRAVTNRKQPWRLCPAALALSERARTVVLTNRKCSSKVCDS